MQGRRTALIQSAQEAAKKKAIKQAKVSEERVEEFLVEGGFYHALAEFLVDLPIFPFACLKGPMVKIVPEIKWPPGGGKPTVAQVPKMFWMRVSPFDIWWTPGVADIANANVIEKSRLTRAEINDLLDLPGFNQDEVRAVLDEYGRGGLYDNWDTTDAERAVLESRENPAWNRSGLITQMEFHGNVQGRVLQEYGMPGVTDELRDYRVDAYCIGSHVIKANLSPSPRARHNYFITSFEKVPGTPLGNGLVDMIADLQDVANATLRSLVNNVSIASGPQVVVNDDRADRKRIQMICTRGSDGTLLMIQWGTTPSRQWSFSSRSPTRRICWGCSRRSLISPTTSVRFRNTLVVNPEAVPVAPLLAWPC